MIKLGFTKEAEKRAIAMLSDSIKKTGLVERLKNKADILKDD